MRPTLIALLLMFAPLLWAQETVPAQQGSAAESSETEDAASSKGGSQRIIASLARTVTSVAIAVSAKTSVKVPDISFAPI